MNRLTLIRSCGFLSLCFAMAACSDGSDAPQTSVSTGGGGSQNISWSSVPFQSLQGWNTASVVAGANAFSVSCDKWKKNKTSVHTNPRFGTGEEWLEVCDRLPQKKEQLPQFFEENFVPFKLSQSDSRGLLTGYYAPEVHGSLQRGGAYQTPVYGKPPAGAKLPDRTGIETNPPAVLKPIAWISDPIELFFLQIQGSGQISFADGTRMRLAYDGQNGHPYVPIGRLLSDRGEIPKKEVSMQTIKAWLRTHPQEMTSLMRENPSYVFFKLESLPSAQEGPRGAANVPLTSKGSIAIDKSFYPFGVPLWIQTTLPHQQGGEKPFSTLLITQDTGGAIKGALRGDVFWGAGDQAEHYSGLMKQAGDFYVLLPKKTARRLENLS